MKDRKDGKVALIVWCLSAIPTGMVTVTTIVFGFPPAGYSLADFFGWK
jgi:hypothetical protein